MKSFVSFVAFFYTHPNEFIYHFRLRLAMILSRFSLEKQRCDHVHILEVCMRCAVVLFWRNKKFNWRKKKTIKAIEILTASFFSRLLFMVGSTKSKTNSHFDVGDLTMTFLFNLRSNCIIDCIQKKQLLRYHINSMRSSLSISGNLLLSSIKKKSDFYCSTWFEFLEECFMEFSVNGIRRDVYKFGKVFSPSFLPFLHFSKQVA